MREVTAELVPWQNHVKTRASACNAAPPGGMGTVDFGRVVTKADEQVRRAHRRRPSFGIPWRIERKHRPLRFVLMVPGISVDIEEDEEDHSRRRRPTPDSALPAQRARAGRLPGD